LSTQESPRVAALAPTLLKELRLAKVRPIERTTAGGSGAIYPSLRLIDNRIVRRKIAASGAGQAGCPKGPRKRSGEERGGGPPRENKSDERRGALGPHKRVARSGAGGPRD